MFLASAVQAGSGNGDRCPGERFAIETIAGGTSPYVMLDAGEKRGYFLLDYGTTRSSLSRDIFKSYGREDQASLQTPLSLPSFSSGRFDLATYRLLEQPPGGQLGIIGTDFLSLLTADFSFRGGKSDVVLDARPCDHDVLKARGLIPVRQGGFFASDPRSLDPSMPNVPVLFVSAAGISAAAQMDTGYDDRGLPPSVDINDAFFAKLVAAGVSLHAIGKVTVTTCRGVATHDVFAAPQTQLSLETDERREIKILRGVALIRKSANGCGGIADMSSPAAQLGMSVIAGLGTVVFDAPSGLVWVRPEK
ncbi:MAG: hypothetical protein QM780_03185 [Hyphomicrobium sp.]|uniref:hypothetical protein n=1 Tax=Hyphomicrobium sp. TaxID=82 RepID=UPI0039E30FA1